MVSPERFVARISRAVKMILKIRSYLQQLSKGELFKMDNYFLKKVFSIKAVVFGDEVNGSY